MKIDVSVILPCRNEELTIGKCIEQIKQVFKKNKIKGEIIVSDSSTDSSADIAKKLHVKIVKHNYRGYGIAILEGFKKSSGNNIIIGDSDGTYDFNEIPLFLEKLKDNDLVIGSRLKGTIKNGAMPLLHRHIGNPFLSKILNIFFHTKISDAHSGFRAIKKTKLNLLNLKTTGMEFASEMIIKAAKNNLKISEVPISYYPRIGKSKLNSFNDGWRHLRFMLMFSPTYLFFIPGSLLFIIGSIFLTFMLFGTFFIAGNNVGLYISVLSSLLTILGYQIINLGFYSRIYTTHTGFEKNDKLIDFIAEKIPLERGILLGIIILLIGLINLQYLRYANILFAVTIIIISIQTIFSVFFISMMVVEKK